MTLSPRERQVLGALLAGCSTKETAHRLGIDRGTVAYYKWTAYRKLGITSDFELGRRAELIQHLLTSETF